MGTLKQKLDYINATKTAIKDAIIAKGQPISDSDTFRSYVDKINAISGGGGGKVDVGAIGFKCGNSNFDAIPTELDFSNVTDMSDMFNYCYNLVSANLPHTENAASMRNMLSYCSSLTSIDLPHTENVTDMSDMFNYCGSLISANLPHTEACVSMDRMFYNCSGLTSVKIGDVSRLSSIDQMFSYCEKLNDITMLGKPVSLYNKSEVFNFANPKGVFTHDYRYDYSEFISLLPTGWTVKTNYTPQECTGLTITAADTIGNSTAARVHYTAVTNGINTITEEQLTGVTVTGDGISEPFEMNPSLTDSKQVTVTFNYLGCSATATITQGPYIKPETTLDLMSNWELAPAETIPSPDLSIYSPVYQSIHKGQGDVKDKMTITFKGQPNFELYIRSYAESNYDYMFVGKLDQAEPTEDDNLASTKGNQQSGTDLASYTKVEYPNDGQQHTITIVYRKDSSGDTGDDRGYMFFKLSK